MNRKEIVIFLVTCVIRIFGTLLFSDKGGRSCPMMTIGNIGSRNFGEKFYNLINGLIIINEPEMVTKTILRHKIVNRRLLCNNISNNVIELFYGRISKKHRLSLIH